MSRAVVNSPSKVNGSSSHATRHRSSASSSRRPRVRKSMPTAAYSPSDHPTPTASFSRPPLSASRLARRLARATGSWVGTTSTLVPSPIRDVAAAAHVRVSSGSNRYGDG